MAKVYKMFQVSMSEAWYQLSKEEQTDIFAKVDEARDKAGGKPVIICDSSWASEEWQAFGIEEFPDAEAVQLHAKLLNEIDWLRYINSRTLIGTEWESPS